MMISLKAATSRAIAAMCVILIGAETTWMKNQIWKEESSIGNLAPSSVMIKRYVTSSNNIHPPNIIISDGCLASTITQTFTREIIKMHGIRIYNIQDRI
jgi:hypothetical protein